jgi:hypothetical protein
MSDRAAPDEWIHVTTSPQATALLASGLVTELSLDHDLGDDVLHGTGMDVIKFICEQQVVHNRDLWPVDGLRLHTANPYGRDSMLQTSVRYASQLHPLTRVTYSQGQPRLLFR